MKEAQPVLVVQLYPPLGSKYCNLRDLPRTIITIPNIEALYTLYLGLGTSQAAQTPYLDPLDPEALTEL